jgi:ADP-heptose:LPS heptosyltransferase
MSQEQSRNLAKAEKSPPLRCLVVHLGKLGNTIQSLMALRAAKQLYPELEISMVTRADQSAAARKVPWIHRVITLPTDSIAEALQTGGKSEQELLTQLARWISPQVERPWDLVINWSFSEVSSWLTALLPARVKLGYSRRKDGSLIVVDGWSQYVQGVIQSDIRQNIHLTDVLTTQILTALQIHVGDPTGEPDSAVTSKAFFKLDRDLESEAIRKDPTRKWIGIQLGSGVNNLDWPAAHWAELCEKILAHHPECSIVLLGSEKDESTAREIRDALTAKLQNPERGLLSLVGAIDFDTWASVIARCHWIVTRESSAVPLASVLGTRVLLMSTGNAHWSETGPYGNGHYIAFRRNAIDPSSLTPGAAYAAFAYAASEWQHRRQVTFLEYSEAKGNGLAAGEVELYRSRIRSTSDGGGVVYEPLLGQALTLQDWSSQVIGHIARSWYCGWTPEVAAEVERSQIQPSFVRELRAVEESATVLVRILRESQRAAQLLHQRSRSLRSDRMVLVHDRDEIQNLSRKLVELDGLLERLVKAQPILNVFQSMSLVLMHNLRGERIGELGLETSTAYQQLAQGAEIFADWARRTLEMARPRILRSASPAEPRLTT